MNKKLLGCLFVGLLFVASCSADNKIGVRASVPGEIVVDFNADNNQVDLIGETGVFKEEIVYCTPHASLQQPINVRLHGLRDADTYNLAPPAGQGNLVPYVVAVVRDDAVWDTAAPEFGQPNVVVNLPAVGDVNDAMFALFITVPDNIEMDAFTPGVLYQDTLTVDVEPVG